MDKPVQYHTGCFPPSKLNLELLLPLVGPANAALARYDGMLTAIPNARILLSPLTTQEAVLSSRIEGTQATMGEVLEYEAKGGTGDQHDARATGIWEVLNYRQALSYATGMLDELPLCQRIILESHKLLLNSVRGHGKSPGEYRKIPNWIGPPGCSIENAKYVPIDANKLPGAMNQWEKYIHQNTPDSLIQLAILHAEFEALHPFLDGNGRLGRMLIPLFLFDNKLVQQPVFYMSAYLENNRDEYYERLLAISKDGDWSGWCVFFLKALQAQAEDNLSKAKAILDLYDRMKLDVAEWTHSQYAIHALGWIFERPIFKTTDFVRSSGIPQATAKRILTILKENNVLREMQAGVGRRAAILSYSELLNIVEGYHAF